jgi:hypothetical protein
LAKAKDKKDAPGLWSSVDGSGSNWAFGLVVPLRLSSTTTTSNAQKSKGHKAKANAFWFLAC